MRIAGRQIDGSLVVFSVLAIGTGTACYLVLGRAAFLGALREDVGLIGFVLPKLGAAMLVAAFVPILLPPRFFARLMGDGTGLRGLAVATAAGTVTPGGPMTSFPIMTVLRDGGTGPGQLVAYLTAWSTLGLQRVFLWEVPLMGVEFAVLRFVVSLPLGIIAGLLMRLAPGERKA